MDNPRQDAEVKDPVAVAMESLDPLAISTAQFQRARVHLDGLKRGLIEFFEIPKRCASAAFPVEMEDGSVHTYRGYRVLHNQSLGPGHVAARYLA